MAEGCRRIRLVIVDDGDEEAEAGEKREDRSDDGICAGAARLELREGVCGEHCRELEGLLLGLALVLNREAWNIVCSESFILEEVGRQVVWLSIDSNSCTRSATAISSTGGSIR